MTSVYGSTRQQNTASQQRISNFEVAGNAICIDATTISGSAQFPTLQSESTCTDVEVINLGPDIAFIAFGTSAPTVVAPVSGTPANGICIPNGFDKIYSKSINTYVGAISAGTSKLYFLQGQGS